MTGILVGHDSSLSIFINHRWPAAVVVMPADQSKRGVDIIFNDSLNTQGRVPVAAESINSQVRLQERDHFAPSVFRGLWCIVGALFTQESVTGTGIDSEGITFFGGG